MSERTIELSADDGKPTREIKRTFEALVLVSLKIDYAPVTQRKTLEVRSLQMAPRPKGRRPADVTSVPEPGLHEILRKGQHEISLASFDGDVGEGLQRV